MNHNVNKERKRREIRKAKKIAYQRRIATMRAVQKAADAARKQDGFLISAKEWFRNKLARFARLAKRTHAAVEQGATVYQREIIAAAQAKRERKGGILRALTASGAMQGVIGLPSA
jgi:hypothetical protein